jgi:hypothetical protein
MRSNSSRYARLDRAHVAHEHIEPALLRQPRRTDTALLSTEDDQASSSELEGYDGQYGEHDAYDPEARDDLALVDAFLLVVVMQGRHQEILRPSPYFFFVYLK